MKFSVGGPFEDLFLFMGFQKLIIVIELLERKTMRCLWSVCNLCTGYKISSKRRTWNYCCNKVFTLIVKGHLQGCNEWQRCKMSLNDLIILINRNSKEVKSISTRGGAMFNLGIYSRRGSNFESSKTLCSCHFLAETHNIIFKKKMQ